MIYDVLDDEQFDNTQTANFAHQGCISLIKRFKVQLYYNFKLLLFSIWIYFKCIYSCEGKADISASLLQC